MEENIKDYLNKHPNKGIYYGLTLEKLEELLDSFIPKYCQESNLPFGILDEDHTKGVIPSFLTNSMFKDGVYHIGGGCLTGKGGYLEFIKLLDLKAKEYIHES
jgi:hypothetical protein